MSLYLIPTEPVATIILLFVSYSCWSALITTTGVFPSVIIDWESPSALTTLLIKDTFKMLALTSLFLLAVISYA